MSDGYLEIAPALRLPLAELDYRATRSGGPGGQHVNTSSTRIEVWWDVRSSPTLTEEQRARLLQALATRLDGEGKLRVVASASRSQLRNREAATHNPYAALSGDVSVADLLAEPMFADPLRRHDCAPVTDGAAALVLAAGDQANEVCERPATGRPNCTSPWPR